MTLNKSLVCLAIASLSIPAMAAPVTTEGAGVGKHGDVIAAVTFDGGRIQAIDIRQSNENPILAGKVFTEMKDAMIKHNTADIDAVIGVEFQEDNLFFFGGHSKKRSLIPKGATGLDFITKFNAAAEKRGIPIITNMKAEELVRDASGRVTGVKATMDGKRYTFSARKGVVIATGGFAANVAMRTEANPFYGDGFKTTNMPSAMGEGITMAKNIGAQVVNMGLIQTYPMCDPNSGAIELIDDARFEGAILVNQEGKRFVEELQRRDVMSKAILEQTGKYCYAIFNGEIEKCSHAITHHQDEVEVFTKTGILHKADTIEGIADFFKIPVDNLKATIARVNEFARTARTLTSTTAAASSTSARDRTRSTEAFRACTTRWAA